MRWSDGLGHGNGRREPASLNDGLDQWRERARKVRQNWSRDADAEALRNAYRDGLKAAGELVEKSGHDSSRGKFGS